MKVGFIGVGKLGMACAEVMSSKHDVVGYDVVPRTSDKIRVSDTLEGAVAGRELIFVAVQTPHDPIYDGSQPSCHLPNKDFDYTTVKQCLKDINAFATPDQLVVLISTVLPGTVRRELRECISNARFIYNPYLIAMGSVEWDMVNPEMVIIGTDDGSETGDAKILTDFYQTIMENNPRYIIGTWDEAEAIKIFYNTFISAKVGLVNMIQDVAIKNGNIDVDVVTGALAQSNMRIMGPKYMTAGMGDAGPCHPRDNIALRWMAGNLGLGYDLFDAIMGAREVQAENLAKELVKQAQLSAQRIYIHGKAYKPNVSYCDGSYSLLVGHYCEQLGFPPIYIDPLTGDDALTEVQGVMLLAHNAGITYDYANIANKEVKLYVKILPGSVIVDPWRQFPRNTQDITVIHYGNTRLSK